MILLVSDIILSFFTKEPIFLFLLNILIIAKNKLPKFIIHSLILDLFFLESYFIPTLIGTLIFIFYKKLKINQVTFFNYFISITAIFLVFTFSLGLINHYSFISLIPVIFKYYLVNLPIYILSYKLLLKNIKLSR